jgi:hypothetical protein
MSASGGRIPKGKLFPLRQEHTQQLNPLSRMQPPRMVQSGSASPRACLTIFLSVVSNDIFALLVAGVISEGVFPELKIAVPACSPHS